MSDEDERLERTREQLTEARRTIHRYKALLRQAAEVLKPLADRARTGDCGCKWCKATNVLEAIEKEGVVRHARA